MSTNGKPIVLSGIRPTADDQHLGNYLGAIRYFVELSNDTKLDSFYFIADQHALTTCGTEFDADGIRRGRRAIVLNLLAAGVNPESTIYAQSAIPEISELAWILSCIAPVHTLQNMHHWEEKKGNLAQLGIGANAGLLTYPVLMAADILGPRAAIVPVGKDQNQHVEFARDIARAFNRVTGTETFPVPSLHEHDELTVKSLSKPTEKMGKFDPTGCVFLNDPSDVVTKKLTRAVSDPQRVQRTDPGNPDVCNVYTLHELMSSGADIAWAREGCKTATIGCFDCKSRLADGVNTILEPIRQRRREMEAGGDRMADEILDAGNHRARTRISETVRAVKDLMGLAQAAWR